ncbi:hypothetical protein BG55_00075 [Erwinia mallotivora]|uniref:Uncharacterized protein n=1 Tax=Erwinia mallotivora TaxID=69222 RepID=A0A014MH11_9GAMM|nr:hypothetical protein BG55_00075 [Erwinia mallotivora]
MFIREIHFSFCNGKRRPIRDASIYWHNMPVMITSPAHNVAGDTGRAVYQRPLACWWDARR